MLKFFNRLGLEYAEKDITKIRRSNRLHSFHTYTLTSEKGDVLLEFRHDIKSHGVYAQGTLDAIRFLRNRLLVTGNRYSTKERYQGQTYSMIDVMKGLMHMHYSRSILKV
jgi:4-hydroxy-tetrahydrodipicolinate reductase